VREAGETFGEPHSGAWFKSHPWKRPGDPTAVDVVALLEEFPERGCCETCGEEFGAADGSCACLARVPW
jgi:hypothetical protein